MVLFDIEYNFKLIKVYLLDIKDSIMLKYNLLESTQKNHLFSKTIFLTICLFIMCSTKISSQETLAHKLGYDKDVKLLIIHADDLGFAHTENVASIKAIEEGSVNSASIIMQGPWVHEIASYAKKNDGKHDLGLHLAITSEWRNFKWGPVASKDKVPTLVNEHGYFYDTCPNDASVSEVEIELRAQIELALAMGIKPTHLDSHMGCLLWGTLEFFEVYLKLANEYGLPCFVDRSSVSLFPNENAFDKMVKDNEVMVVLDKGFTISPQEYSKGSEQYYTDILKSIQPGLTQILIHTAYDNEEMQAITVDHSDWGATWRQGDYDFFTSDACKKLIEKENIVLVTWREITQALKK